MPLLTLTVKVVEPPGQLVALAGVMLHTGLGKQTFVAKQGWLMQFRASVTTAVKVQLVGDVILSGQTKVMFVEPAWLMVTVRLVHPLNTTV